MLAEIEGGAEKSYDDDGEWRTIHNDKSLSQWIEFKRTY
jgi:hypothetical protein